MKVLNAGGSVDRWTDYVLLVFAEKRALAAARTGPVVVAEVATGTTAA